MPALTPDERRGGLLVVALLLIGAGWDAWRAATTPARPRGAFHAAAGRFATPADSAPPAGRVAPPDSAAQGRPRVDLNRADVRDLDGLPGIGPVLAARIVEHREKHGSFRSVDELRAVRGVGPRLLERLRPRVRAGP